jgi:hypothetical protein
MSPVKYKLGLYTKGDSSHNKRRGNLKFYIEHFYETALFTCPQIFSSQYNSAIVSTPLNISDCPQILTNIQ